MKFMDENFHKLILKKVFSYYPEDKYLIREIMKFVDMKYPKVLDVGYNRGHYSFLFDKNGAKVIAFNYSQTLIEMANENIVSRKNII